MDWSRARAVCIKRGKHIQIVVQGGIRNHCHTQEIERYSCAWRCAWCPWRCAWCAQRLLNWRNYLFLIVFSLILAPPPVMTSLFSSSQWQSCLADLQPRMAAGLNAPIAPGLFREFVQFSAEAGRRKLGSGEVRVCLGVPLEPRDGFMVGNSRHQGRVGIVSR